MITIEQIREQLLPRIADLSVMNRLVNVIYVDSNPAVINYVEVQKKDGLVIEVKNSEKHKLKKHQLIVKKSLKNSMIISDEVNTETIQKDATLCECFSMRINRGFMDVIDDLSKIQKENWKFFNRNFFSKIFLQRTTNDLIHKIVEIGKDYSYIIVSAKVASVIRKSNFFTSQVSQCQSIIKNIGELKIDNISLDVYIDPELQNNNVYFAKYDSVNLVLNKNLNIIETKTSLDKTNITVEVEYTFLEKESIKCLCL